MREAAYAAVYRYDAMAGRLSGIPEEDERQGEADRARFGETYLAFDESGEYIWHPLLTIRFMAEICGIPLQESRDAVIERYRETRIPSADEPTMPPERQARELLAKFGNILEAREMALLASEMLADVEGMSRFWCEVVQCIQTTALVPEDTGAGNER